MPVGLQINHCGFSSMAYLKAVLNREQQRDIDLVQLCLETSIDATPGHVLPLETVRSHSSSAFSSPILLHFNHPIKPLFFLSLGQGCVGRVRQLLPLQHRESELHRSLRHLSPSNPPTHPPTHL